MSPKFPRITAAELLHALQQDGWEIARQSGSHIQLVHPSKSGRVTVAYHSGATLRPKTVASALAQAGLTEDDLRRVL